MNRRERRQTGQWLGLVLLVLAFLADKKALGQSTNSDTVVGSHRLVLVSLTDRKLAVVENGTVVRIFPIAVGAAGSPSPTGEFEIINRVSHPTYYHAGEVISPGKDNPIGTRWVGLSKKGYGIHGTNVPRSIGKAASHGCIRLRNRDIEQLFSMLRVGDTVQIHGERDQQISEIFGDNKETAQTTVAQASSATMATDGGQ